MADDIDERIRLERENMQAAIFPSERKRHADTLAKLEAERDKPRTTIPWWHFYIKEDGE